MIGISACLAGIPCRYDGRSKGNEECWKLLLAGKAVLLCPEVFGGLDTPRSPSELPPGGASSVLSGKARIINSDGRDVTKEYLNGAEMALEICKENGITEVWLKTKSPACGYGFIYDGTYTRTLTRGNGILAELLIGNGIRVIPKE